MNSLIWEALHMDFRSPCPLASALDIFGDRWTLVVLRTIFIGHNRYSDLLKMPEKISTNILADRLALLEREGLIAPHPYQHHPLRNEYRLTRKGADLLPVLHAMAQWSAKHVPERWAVPEWFAKAEPTQFYPV
jgi:DNA-binding HxlR family transcriptional regulator